MEYIKLPYIAEKYWFLVFCIFLVPSAGTDGSSDYFDTNYVDLDYEAEDAAREEILRDQAHNNLDVAKTNVQNVHKNKWTENDTEESLKTSPDLLTSNAITHEYLLSLCVHSRYSTMLFPCNKSHEEDHACLERREGVVTMCRELDKNEVTFKLCYHEITGVLEFCSTLTSAKICAADEENIYPLSPCNGDHLQLCLTKENNIDRCKSILNAKNDVLREDEYLHLSEELGVGKKWWKEWDSDILGIEKKKPVSVRTKLCIEEDDEKIVGCSGTLENSSACVNSKSGEIHKCKSIKEKDVPIFICLEAFSNKVITCDKNKSAFLCSSDDGSFKTLHPCQLHHLHACLNEEGSVVRCIKTEDSGVISDSPFNPRDHVKVWEEWWSSWYNHTNHPGNAKYNRILEHEEDRQEFRKLKLIHDEADRSALDQQRNKMGTALERLCNSFKRKGNFFAPCDNSTINDDMCVSAKYGVIDNCNLFNGSAMPVPVCVGERRKIVTCGEQYISATLCFRKDTTISGMFPKIHPCKNENLFICLNESQKLTRCKKIKAGNAFVSGYVEEKPPTVNPSGTQNPQELFNEWWDNHLVFPEDAKEMIPQEEVKLEDMVHLCKPDNQSDRLERCKTDHDKACLSISERKLVRCRDYDAYDDLLIQVCTEKSDRKQFLTCEYGSSFLCSARDGKHPIVPCNFKKFQLCWREDGLLENCPKEVSKNSTTAKPTTVGDSIFKIFRLAKKLETRVSTNNRMVSRKKKNMKPKSEVKSVTSSKNIVSKKTSNANQNTSSTNHKSASNSHDKISSRVNLEDNHKRHKRNAKLNSWHVIGHDYMDHLVNDKHEDKIADGKETKVTLKTHENSLREFNKSNVKYMDAKEHAENAKMSFWKIDGKNDLDPLIDKEKDRLYFFDTTGFDITSLNKSTAKNVNNEKNILKIKNKKTEKSTITFKKLPGLNKSPSVQGNHGLLSKILDTLRDRKVRHKAEKESFLCKLNNGSVRPCNESEEYEKICFEKRFGKITQCKDIKEQDLLVYICEEKSSGRITACGQNIMPFFFCMSLKNTLYDIIPCSEGHHPLCLSEETGSILVCNPRGSTNRKSIVSSEMQLWEDWWSEWHRHYDSFASVWEELKDMGHFSDEFEFLCMTENKELVPCSENSSMAKPCLSVREHYIDDCKKFKDEDTVAPVCLEAYTHKLITCGDLPEAYLCYPSNDRLKPIRPCTLMSRQICLKDGILQKCFNTLRHEVFSAGEFQKSQHISFVKEEESSEHHGTSADWSDRWKEWHKGSEVAEQELGPGVRLALLCKDKKRIEECDISKSFSKLQLCVIVPEGKISLCHNAKGENLVHICVDTASRKIMTCGQYAYAHLCYTDEVKGIVNPCRSTNRQVCLNDEGDFKKCKNVQSIGEQTAQLQYLHAKPVKQPKLYYLCKGLSDTYFVCSKATSVIVVCINTNTWNLEPCFRTQANSEIGLPVCIEDETFKLWTCDNFTYDGICFSTSPEAARHGPCKGDTSGICVADDETLQECPQNLKGHWYNSDTFREAVVYPNSELDVPYIKYSHMEYLCISKNGNSITACGSQTQEIIACMNIEDGKIGICNATNSFMSIQVCSEVGTHAVMTCGRANSVHLCLPQTKQYGFSVCQSAERYVCLEGGVIGKCGYLEANGNQLIRTRRDKIRKISKPLYRSSDTFERRNSDVVYFLELAAIDRLLRKSHLLCEKEKKIVMCQEDPNINIVCLGQSGKVKICETISEKEASIPLCLEVNHKHVMVCGKVFMAHLCSSSSSKSDQYETCSKVDRQICLGKDGTLEACDDNRYRSSLSRIRRKIDGGKSLQKSLGRKKERRLDKTKKIAYRKHNYSKDNQTPEIATEEITDERTTVITDLTTDQTTDELTDTTTDEPAGSGAKIFKKMAELIVKMHKTLENLCMANDSLVICNEVKDIHFACVGIKTGYVKDCVEFTEDEMALPICEDSFTRVIHTCGIVSSVQLCYNNKKPILGHCDEGKPLVCLTDEGMFTICPPMESTTSTNSEDTSAPEGTSTSEGYTTDESTATSDDKTTEPTSSGNTTAKKTMKLATEETTTSVGATEKPSLPSHGSLSEKFIRLICSNCSIDNTIVVDGEPDDILPEVEVITFST